MKHMCGTCGEELEMRAFVEGNKTTLDSWSDAVERDVFLQGVCATCLACKKKGKVDLFRCAQCGIQKDMMSFGRDAKSLTAKSKSKHREQIICSECLFPSCENPQCPRCKSCLEESCTAKGSCTAKPNYKKQSKLKALTSEAESLRCQGCRLRCCPACKLSMCNREFPNNLHATRCTDCSHPPCANPACETCKTCRDPACNNERCSQKPKPLHSVNLACIGDNTVYECDACLFPACETLHCDNVMTKQIRQIKRKSESWKTLKTRTWLCAECSMRTRDLCSTRGNLLCSHPTSLPARKQPIDTHSNRG